MYTKGNWKAHKNILGTWTIATDLAHIADVDRHFNAQLIASAPDLYEALGMAMRVLRDNDIDESMAGEFEILTDALAKADGGT